MLNKRTYLNEQITGFNARAESRGSIYFNYGFVRNNVHLEIVSNGHAGLAIMSIDEFHDLIVALVEQMVIIDGE